MMNGWPDIQQKMVEDWWKLITVPLQTMQANAVPPSMEAWVTGALDQWRAYTQQWSSTFTPDFAAGFAPPFTELTRNALEQFLASQQQSLQLMGMTGQAWQAIMSGANTPDDWSKVLQAHMEQLRQQLSGSLNAFKTGQNSVELWQRYLDAMNQVGQPWLTDWLQMQQGAGQSTDPRQAASAGAIKLNNLFWETFNGSAGRLLGAPSLGLTREFSEKVNRSFLRWQEHQKVSVDYQLLIGNTWLNAFAAFMQKLLDMAQAGETITKQEELLELWVEVADEQFIQVFHTDAFAQVQSAYINSSMALRRQQRELAEIWLRMHDLPTRSDLDAAHQAIFELRQEVKALKKALRAQATSPAPMPTPPVEVKTPKTRTVKPKVDKVRANGVGQGVEGQ